MAPRRGTSGLPAPDAGVERPAGIYAMDGDGLGSVSLAVTNGKPVHAPGVYALDGEGMDQVSLPAAAIPSPVHGPGAWALSGTDALQDVRGPAIPSPVHGPGAWALAPQTRDEARAYEFTASGSERPVEAPLRGRPLELDIRAPVPLRSYQPSFEAGEIMPALHRRSDLAPWRAAVGECRNFIVIPQGGLARRAGTQFVGSGKDSAGNQRLIPFQFSTEDQYVIEAGGGYMRFIYRGAYVAQAGGAPYEIATPYPVEHLPSLRTVQSADVLTIVHILHPIMELRRYAALDWRLVPFSVGSQITPPGNVQATGLSDSAPSGSPPVSDLSYNYAVTASSRITKDESPLSANATCTNKDLGYYKTNGTRNRITWDAAPGADFYTVFRFYQGAWAKIAATTDLFFLDTNYLPDTTTGPPQGTDPFADGNYPGTVGYFQERRVFGGSLANPETMWFSRSGNYRSFDVANPVKDDDGITYTLAARQVNQIRHLLPLDDLIVMTGGGGWRIGGDSPVTPGNCAPRALSFAGSSDVEPLVIGGRILFADASGSGVREVIYQFAQNSYVSEDRTPLAKHLFAGHRIVSWAYAEVPDKVVWVVRDDGALLSLTYLPEQKVAAWAQHSTVNGSYRAVTTVSENTDGITEDVPYFVVARVIGGQAVSMIERMHSRQLGASGQDGAHAWHLDCALRYEGAPKQTFTGLSHLEGQPVAAFADGGDYMATVSGGAVTLPVAASVVLIGFACLARVTTLPADGPQPAVDPWMGRTKRAYRVRVAVDRTHDLALQVDGGPGVVLQNVDEGADDDGLLTGVLEHRPTEGWTIDGRVSLSPAGGAAATVLGMAVEWIVQ